MNQDGYLLLLVIASAFLVMIVLITSLDIVQTRRGGSRARWLLAEALDKFTAERSDMPGESDTAMRVVRDVVLTHETLSKSPRGLKSHDVDVHSKNT